jgi:FkbM family methyltransferase
MAKMPMQSQTLPNSRDVRVAPPETGVRNSRSESRHVFDVGMNNGDDSAYYLWSGCRVVAVEPNPVLAQRARERFSAEIARGQFVLEEVGIGAAPGKILFWVNEERDVFSSFDPARASRGGMKCREIEVECVTFDTLLRKHGVPYYLKIDAEGAEPHCIASLQSFGLPQYVSVEAESLEFLLLLWQLGYRQFKLVDQMRHNSRFPSFSNENIISRVANRVCGYADRVKNRKFRVTFPRGSSGPFGEDTSGRWKTVEEVAYHWLHFHFGHSNRGSLAPGTWCDFHAKNTHLADG